MLEEALMLAIQAHMGQKDKAGCPYILHPLRVMMKVEGLDAKTVAILHDVVEDTHVGLDELRSNGFSPGVLEAVDCLTRRQDETYEDFVLRIKPNELARQVKLADLSDNMNTRRLPTFREKDARRLEKYHRAWIALNTP